jgi:hypothetical protein
MTYLQIHQKREELEQEATFCGVPKNMSRYSLIMYILEGLPVGDFLTALLTNDLKGTFQKADEENIKKIYQYVYFMWNHAPIGCWGSLEKVQEWQNHDGLKGLKA